MVQVPKVYQVKPKIKIKGCLMDNLLQKATNYFMRQPNYEVKKLWDKGYRRIILPVLINLPSDVSSLYKYNPAERPFLFQMY